MSRNRMEQLQSDDEIEMDSIEEEDLVNSTEMDDKETTFTTIRSETKWIRDNLKCREAERKKPTDAYGDILFFEDDIQTGKYVRVDVDTKMNDMKRLMFGVWKMEKPSLLISVIGGGDNFKMSKRLKETFKFGLMKTALTTGAWIITGGTHAGLSKDVGEAVNDFKQNPVVTIGIVPWGCVQNREKLVTKFNGPWFAGYLIQKEETNPKESFLDPNHSHYILVDNATEGDFDIEIPFRVKLEEMLVKTQTDKGGIRTLETVHAAIQKNIPAVIVKGSGGVADILAYAYKNSKEIEATNQGGNSHKITRRRMEDPLTNHVKEMVEREFKSDKIDEHMTWIKECLDENDLLTVFELENTSGSRELELAMLKALLKANKNNLRLALEWNMIDVVKNDILTDVTTLPTQQLHKLMPLAIELNRADFVELFLNHGVSLKKIVTPYRLVELYNKMPEYNSLLRTLLNEVKEKAKEKTETNSFSLLDVVRLIQELIGDNYRNSFIDESSNEENDIADKNKVQALFILFVLMNQQDMAKIFWAAGNDAIAGALVANSLLKAMKKKTEDAELAIKMQKHIDEWSNLAIGVLTECQSTDVIKTYDLLLQEMLSWGNATCMSIAVKADNKEFISKAACNFNHIWMGKLTWKNNVLKLLMCALFPPLALWLVKYVGVSPDTSEQKTPCEKQHSVRKRFIYFFTAPVIVFIYNMMSYSVFLALFAYVLLFNFNPKVSGEEIVLIVWVFTFFTEELRQVAMTSQVTLKRKLRSYITDSWNVLDLITICLFTIGTILRFVPNPNTFEAARLVLALSFLTFCMRLLHLFSAHKELGPILVVTRLLVQYLMYFAVVLMVFVVSYAIASHAIMFPNSPFTWNTINQMMRRSYWNIYGELLLDEIEGEDDCTFDEALWNNGIHPRCPSGIGKHAGTILMGVYMLLTNVLLLNLLIAMTNNCWIQHYATDKWLNQRCYLMTEYYTRPVLCPPFIVFSHVFLLIRHVKSRCGDNDRFDQRMQILIQWEKEIADEFHRKSKLKQRQSTENKISNIRDRLQMLINNVDEIQEMMNQQTTLISNALSVPMTNRIEMEQKIEWIIKKLCKRTTWYPVQPLRPYLIKKRRKTKIQKDKMTPFNPNKTLA